MLTIKALNEKLLLMLHVDLQKSSVKMKMQRWQYSQLRAAQRSAETTQIIRGAVS